MIKFDLLVYMAMLLVLVALVGAAILIYNTPDSTDLEKQKLRIATVTLTGIMIVFVLVIVFYFVSDPAAAGKEIFDKAYTAMLTLVGTIAGYIFGSRSGKNGADEQAAKQGETPTATT